MVVGLGVEMGARGRDVVMGRDVRSCGGSGDWFGRRGCGEGSLLSMLGFESGFGEGA